MLTPDINQHPNSFLRQYLGYTVHHHLQYKPKTGIHGWQVSQQVWCDTPQCGRDDRPRCGTVTDLFKKPAEQKEWSTGVQWDTVASRPVDFTHTAAAADTPCVFQQQKPAGEPACSVSFRSAAWAANNTAEYLMMFCMALPPQTRCSCWERNKLFSSH